MFKSNEGTMDRALRIAVGALLLAWFYLDSGEGTLHYAKLVGVVPLLTGLIGSCPIHSVLGLSTCPMKQA